MKLYARAFLAYGVTIPGEYYNCLNRDGRLHKFNERTGAGLGYFTSGVFAEGPDEADLFLTAFCVSASPGEPSTVKPGGPLKRWIWRRRIEEFEHE